MSLTSMLDDRSFKKELRLISPSKECFTSNTNYPAFSKENEIHVPFALMDRREAALVGQAADYLFRFMVAKKIHNKPDVTKDLICFLGLQIIIKSIDASLTKKVYNAYQSGIETVKQFVGGKRITIQKLSRVSLMFAFFENAFRKGIVYSNITDIINTKDFEKDIIDDIAALGSEFQRVFITGGLVRENSVVVFNPGFGIWSANCGGADADIYIDGVLYDFKCTTALYKDATEILQLYGYFLLYELCRQDNLYEEIPWIAYPIKAIAIYKARHGLINKCVLENSDADFSENALKHFRNRIIEIQEQKWDIAREHLPKITGSKDLPIETTRLYKRNIEFRGLKKGDTIYLNEIGKALVVEIENKTLGTVISMQFEGKTVRARAVDILQNAYIENERKEHDIGDLIYHARHHMGRITAKKRYDDIVEYTMYFPKAGLKAIRKGDDFHSVQPLISLHDSFGAFPYEVGDNVIWCGKESGFISGIMCNANEKFIEVQLKIGQTQKLSVADALVDLSEELYRYDIQLINYKTGDFLFDDSIIQGMAVLLKRKCGGKVEETKGVIMDIETQNGRKRIQISFEDGWRLWFLGPKFWP